MSSKTSHRRTATIRRDRIAHTLRTPATHAKAFDLLARTELPR
jgi:hypothetical protein